MIDQNDFNSIFFRPPNFCAECGEMLDFEIVENGMVQCQKCGGEASVEEITTHNTETESLYHNSKEWMNKLANIEDKFRAKQHLKKQIIEEKCPMCPSTQMYFQTMQTRSADEGTTVFYECVNCKYFKKENN